MSIKLGSKRQSPLQGYATIWREKREYMTFENETCTCIRRIFHSNFTKSFLKERGLSLFKMRVRSKSIFKEI